MCCVALAEKLRQTHALASFANEPGARARVKGLGEDLQAASVLKRVAPGHDGVDARGDVHDRRTPTCAPRVKLNST
ncbi:MAG: hypothetical protein DI536_08885 [Archangium gephyra]|uniref:Uncharacterized protein n=1 Tax=Archangium gephyra TaxID=48 RepID=A0A2W5THA7_9BACT|nr:MAG: hypothetical protein DI536_08885 [Archangium gephyra]